MKQIYSLTLALLTGMPVFSQIPANGLVAKYDFFNKQSFLSDGSVNGNTLCAGGGTVTRIAGRINGDSAANFNSLSYLNYCGGNGGDFQSGSVSISAWFKRSNINAYETIAVMRYDGTQSPYNSINLFTGNSAGNKLSFAFSNSSQTDVIVSGTTNLQFGIWYYGACTYDAGTGQAKLYLNGVMEYSVSSTAEDLIYSGMHNLTIGHIPGGAGYNGFNGAIDQVLYYDRALSAAEVCGIYSGAPCTVGLKELSNTSSIRIYPNPAKDVLTLDFGAWNEKTEIMITDVTGKQVLRHNTTGQQPGIDLNGLQPGIYFLQSNSGARAKFIKE